MKESDNDIETRLLQSQGLHIMNQGHPTDVLTSWLNHLYNIRSIVSKLNYLAQTSQQEFQQPLWREISGHHILHKISQCYPKMRGIWFHTEKWKRIECFVDAYFCDNLDKEFAHVDLAAINQSMVDL